MINQQHCTRIFKCLCDYVSRWHSDIFQHAEKTSETCAEDIEKTWWTDIVCQQEKESIQNAESMLSEICHMTEQNHSKPTKNKSSHELTEIHETEESTDLFESSELLLTICCTALSYSGISDIFYTEEQRISLRCRTKKDLCES